MICKRALIRILCLVLCLMLTFPSVLSAEAVMDYKGHWAEESIKILIEKGFVKGYPDGTFKPEGQISRAEFMAIANRAFGFNDKAEISFKDIKGDGWYYEHIARAVKAGYIKGFPDGTMRPDSNITRQEAAVILSRILSIEESADTKVMADVRDIDKIQEWGIKGVAAIISKDYISLRNDFNFEPDTPLTRAEMAAAVEKSYLKHEKKLYAIPGTYVGGNIDGSIRINNQDITLKDTVINGDLILDKGIGEGNVYLNNVVVKGETIVKGGGENSIVLENCEFKKIIIIKENNKIRILAKGNTKISETDVQSGAVIESEDLPGEGFGFVTIAEGLDEDAIVELIGNFQSVEIRAEGVQIQASGGTIGSLEITETAADVNITLAANSDVTTLTANAAATVTGTGTIETAQINVSGSTIEVPVTNVEKPADVTVNIVTTTPASGSNDDNDDDDDDDQPSTVSVNAITVTGNTVVGSVLTAVPSPSEATVNYQWKSADTADGSYTNITGATSGTYTLADTDAGKFIKVTVTGTGSYTGTQTSGATAAIVGIFATPMSYEPPGGLLGKSNTVALFGTIFAEESAAEALDNWAIDTGTTNLTVSSITRTGDQNVTIDYTLRNAGQGTGTGTIAIKAKAAAVEAGMDTNEASIVIEAPTISTASTITVGDVDPIIVVTLTNDTFTEAATLPANWTGSVGTTGLMGGTITRDSDTQITFQMSGTAEAGTLTLQANPEALTGGAASNTITITIPEASEPPVVINEINTAMIDMRRGSIIMGYTFSGDAGIITYEQAISDTYALDLENSYVTLAKYDGTNYTQIGNTVNLSTLSIENSNVEGESAKVTFEDFETLLNVFGLDFSNPDNIPSHERVIVKSKTTIGGSDVANPWGPIDSGWIAIDSELINPVGISTENSTATVEPGNKTAVISFPVNIHIKDENSVNLPDGNYSVQILNGDTPIGGGAEIYFTGGQASVDAILAAEGTYTLIVKVNNTEIESIANVTAVSSPVLEVSTTTMDGTQIHLTFSKEMADPSGKGNQFTVTVDSIKNPITAAALKIGDSKTIELTLTNCLHGGETISIGYERGDVTASDGGILCTFAPAVVTNTIPENILAEEITIVGEAGALEVANGGTLQMTATVLPEYASDKSVTWSITNGTGSATISENGLLTGTGPGTVTVKATANDGSGIVGERAITVINNAPAAENDTASVDEDSTVLVDVLVNDTDVDGDTLSITGFTQGTNGTVNQEGDSLRYTPDTNYNGADSFTYDISDGMGGTATATVNVTIEAAPVLPPEGDLLDSAAGSNFTGVLYTRDGNIYYNQADSSGTWESETLIGIGTEGALAIDSSGSPHAVYTTNGAIGYRMYNGSTWTVEELIESNNLGTCSKPDIAVDGSGYAHITYTDTMGSSGDPYTGDDIMYATNASGSFAKELIFYGYKSYIGNCGSETDQSGEFYIKGSKITVDSNGIYYILSHHRDWYRYGTDQYNTYKVVVASETSDGCTTTNSSDIYDIYDLKSNGDKVVALYKHSSFKTSELTVSGTDINFTNTTDLTGSSVSSAETDGTNVAVGGLSSTNLQTHYNGTGYVYNDIVVKGTRVSMVNLNGTFYAVYTDNSDNIIKSTEISTLVLVSEITVTGSGSVTEVVYGETLQMNASVLPINATDPSVTWSVEPGTGTASISEEGLLTGTGIGTVTVKAAANDGSSVEGTLTVTVAAPDPIISAIPIDYNASNPSTCIGLTWDTFAAGAENLDNWTIDAGTTGLTLSAIALHEEPGIATSLTMDFTGTAEAGTLTIQAEAAALTGGVASNAANIEITAP